MIDAATTDVQAILDAGPSEANAWLSQVMESPGWFARRSFNWRLLAQAASSEAQATVDQDQAQWAQLALNIYENVLPLIEPPNSTESVLRSAMMLRAFLISEHGAKAGDSLLDPSIVTGWFWSKLTMSCAEAEQQAKELRSRLLNGTFGTDSEEQIFVAALGQLRAIKNRLSVLREMFANNAGLQPSEEETRWLRIWDMLP